MIRKIVIASLYSIVAFCVVSYISVITSLLSSEGDPPQKPVINLGFPFKYYYQFWLYGSDSPNYGWSFNYFILDFLIICIVTTTIYLVVKRKK